MHRHTTLKLTLEKRREIYTLPILAYVKASDQVNRYTLFNILHKRNIPEPLLSALVKIYKYNEIKTRLDNKMSQSVEINKDACQGCPLSSTLFNIYTNKILPESTQTI
jgi:hypothetical protein